MPADINLFDMLRLNVLTSMPRAQLLAELDRTLLMQARVSEYAGTIIEVLRSSAAPPHQKGAAPTDTGGSEPAR